MRQVNCYIPIKVCITGRLGDAHLDQLGQAVTRTIAARMEQARRTLGEHGYAAGETVASAHERFDPARLSNGRYGLPSYDKGGETVTVPVTGEAQADPWDKLSLDGRKEAQELNDTCWRWIRKVAAAQQAHVSVLRAGWLNGLNRELNRIGNLDSDDDIEDVSDSLTRYTKFIAINMLKFDGEWRTVEKRYLEERRWLLSQKSTDATEAAKWIEELYKEAKGYLDRGAINLITDEDYFVLKETLDKGKHILLGILRGSRIRAKKLKDMMDVVADLRRHGEDAEKYVPDWSRRVLEETAHLDLLSRSTSEGFAPESLAEFSNLRNELLGKREEALKAHPPEKSILEKGVEFVAGGVEAVTGIFVEAAKEAYDLAQIALHFVSYGKYEPKFRSDMAKAAEQGATTSELLKGMVMGIIETPSRFLKACEDGDWEAIGKETVNLYFLAKTLKESPELVKNLTKTAVVTTNRALRILRARTVALEIEARLLPPAPTAEPKVLTTPAGAAGEAVPSGKVTEPGAATPKRTTTEPKAEAQKGTTAKPSRTLDEIKRDLRNRGLTPDDISSFRGGAKRLSAALAERVERLSEHFSPAEVKQLGEYFSKNKIALTEDLVDALIQKVPRGKMGEYVRHLEIAEVHGAVTKSRGWPGEEQAPAEGGKGKPRQVTAAPKSRPVPPENFEDIFEQVGLSERKSLGTKKVRPDTETGLFAHKQFKNLEDMLAAFNKDAAKYVDRFPTSGHIKQEFPIDLPDDIWPGPKPRVDLVDWDNAKIYEIKPRSEYWIRKGEAQAQQYAQWMKKYHKRADGKIWEVGGEGGVLTYDKDVLMAWLRDKGYLPKK